MSTFGKRVRQLRHANGLTIRQVADVIERDFTYVSKIENDRVLPPSAEVINSLATLLGVDPEELAILGNKPPISVVRRQLAELKDIAREFRSGQFDLLDRGRRVMCQHCSRDRPNGVGFYRLDHEEDCPVRRLLDWFNRYDQADE